MMILNMPTSGLHYVYVQVDIIVIEDVTMLGPAASQSRESN